MKQVLIVDDSAVIRKIARRILEGMRFEIVEAEDGTRTLCHPRGKKTECVVGDRVRWAPTGDEGVIEGVEPRRNLLHRQVTTTDVALSVEFLLSERSSRTTGAVLPIDGGVAGAFPR